MACESCPTPDLHATLEKQLAESVYRFGKLRKAAEETVQKRQRHPSFHHGDNDLAVAAVERYEQAAASYTEAHDIILDAVVESKRLGCPLKAGEVVCPKVIAFETALGLSEVVTQPPANP